MATIYPARKRKKRVSGALVFLLAFIVFVLLAGAMSVWMVIQFNKERSTVSPSSTSISGNTAETVVYEESDARNLLLITLDGTQPQGFVVLRTDPANFRIRTLALPCETELAVGTELLSLADVYTKKGVTQTRDAIASLLGMQFQNYAVITYANLEKMITYLGSDVIFTITENLRYQSDDGSYAINMSGGRRTLTPAQVTSLLRYPNWSSGSALIQAQITAAIVNQYMTKSRLSALEEDFNQFVNLCVTKDILRRDFAQAQSGLEYLATRNTSLDSPLCVAVLLPGKYVVSDSGSRFLTAEDAAQQLRLTFNNTVS